jgi:hypothetical protein
MKNVHKFVDSLVDAAILHDWSFDRVIYRKIMPNIVFEELDMNAALWETDNETKKRLYLEAYNKCPYKTTEHVNQRYKRLLIENELLLLFLPQYIAHRNGIIARELMSKIVSFGMSWLNN